MRMRTWLVPAISFLVVAEACAQPSGPDVPLADSGAAYFPAATWRTASASAAGFDRDALASLGRDLDAKRFGTVDGVAIVRFGHLVYEHYASGWNGTRPHTMQSVTKSVTSLLY